ncbi:MAG: PqqD family peptide modification chaperone [bacterium]
MRRSSSLPESLRCPRCGAAFVEGAADRLDCGGCGASHPVFDGLPWLYRDVASSRSQWASKLQRLRDEILAELAELDGLLARGVELESTRERLAGLRAGTERLGRQIFALLEPFGFAASEVNAGLPRDRIPSRQHLSSYLETVFRDWSWGEPEVQAALGLLDPLLGGAPAGRDALVIGGGAGRLAYELSRLGEWGSVVQLDINPLLTRVGACLARGQSLTLTEIPRLPMGLEHVAVDQHLERPSDAPRSPLHHLIGDLFTPPFAAGSFDLLVTPWLVDILPESFDRVARRLNALIAPGGSWISFGPLSFESLPLEARFTREEMEEALEAAGMEVETSELQRVPHLHSPHGMPRRSEEILVFRAIRREPAALDEPFSFYPSWMTDPSESVPALPRFEQMRRDRVFEGEILGCIDGRTSIRDIVDRLSERYSLPRDRCENAVNRFFSRIHEEEDARSQRFQPT